MAYRSAANLAGTSLATAVVPVPTGAAIGDIAIVGVYKENTAAITPPAGFTQKAALTNTAGTRGSLYVFWKRLTAADTGTYTFTWTGSTFRTGGCALFSGRIASGDPFDGTVGTAESVAAVLTLNVSTSPAAANGDAVGLWTNFNSGNGFTQPTNYLERVDNGDLTIATRDAVASGTTGNVSATSNLSDFQKAFLGVLAVAGGGGTTPVTATRSTTWRVAAQVTATRSTTWRVAAQTTGTRAATWRVRAGVTGTRATTWRVAAGVMGTRATTWRVRSAVTSTRSTTWAVASTLATVTAARATTWRVTARVTATRVAVWDTRTVVTSSRVATWDVLTRTTATRVATWDTLARSTATRSTTWRVRARATATRSTTWAVDVILVPYTPPEVVTATVRVYMSTASPRDRTSTATVRRIESATVTARRLTPSASARQAGSTATARSPE